MKKTVIFSALIVTALLTACAENVLESSSAQKPATTIQEIMVSIIDPNIDYVWNSVATINTAKGTEERQPKTDQDWKLVKQHALTVLEAGNLLKTEGLPVAAEQARTSSAAAELEPKGIQALINSHRADYLGHIDALQKAVQQAIVAIDAKNVAELERAGGVIDQACEQCHSQFWYPGDKRPK